MAAREIPLGPPGPERYTVWFAPELENELYGHLMQSNLSRNSKQPFASKAIIFLVEGTSQDGGWVACHKKGQETRCGRKNLPYRGALRRVA